MIYGDIPRVTQGALYISAYWILFVLVSYSYTRSAFSDPGSPDQYNIKITANETEDQAAFDSKQYDPVNEEDTRIIYLPRSTARMCGICNAPKPPRTHHCSTCRQCFLKMDHHCVWLDNCVGHKNYKFFFCLLFWATFMCGFIFGATLEVLIQQLVYSQLEGVSVVWLVMTVFSFALGLSTFMLLFYHTYLISNGMTTIEHMEYNEEREDFKRRERIRKRQLERELNAKSTVTAVTSTSQNQQALEIIDDNRSATRLLQPKPAQPQARTPTFNFQNYSEGLYKNWCSALGSNPLLWLIPVSLPTGNGIRFRKEEAAARRNAV